jgi:hypothetical protein
MSKLVADLASLVSDHGFQRLGSLQNQPNLFRAVGRTFTETWHSAFLLWLLHPSGSHGLGAFPLQCFLTSAARSAWHPENPAYAKGFLSPAKLAMLAATRDLSEARVLPNEFHPEKSIAVFGRVDGWIELDAITEESGEDAAPPLRIIIEMKVKASKRDRQCIDYADHLEKEAGPDGKQAEVLAVFVAPRDVMGGTSRDATDDGRWYCLDFQMLHDDLFIPSLEHPGLSTHMRPLVEHYLLNLRSPRGTEGRMAYTKEEKELARKIHARHIETFRALAEILREVGDFPEEIGQLPGEAAALATGRTLTVNGTELGGESVGDLFVNTINFIWNSNCDLPAVPFNAGPSRYLIAASPNHPDGRPMASSRQIESRQREALFIDTKYSWDNGIKQAQKLLEAAGFKATRPS